MHIYLSIRPELENKSEEIRSCLGKNSVEFLGPYGGGDSFIEKYIKPHPFPGASPPKWFPLDETLSRYIVGLIIRDWSTATCSNSVSRWGGPLLIFGCNTTSSMIQRQISLYRSLANKKNICNFISTPTTSEVQPKGPPPEILKVLCWHDHIQAHTSTTCTLYCLISTSIARCSLDKVHTAV